MRNYDLIERVKAETPHKTDLAVANLLAKNSGRVSMIKSGARALEMREIDTLCEALGLSLEERYRIALELLSARPKARGRAAVRRIALEPAFAIYCDSVALHDDHKNWRRRRDLNPRYTF
jgi:hypothetical protein